MSSRRRSLRIILFAAATLARAAPIVAAEPPANAAAVQQEFEEGRRLLASKQYDEALVVLRRVHAAYPSVGALFNIAEAEERRGHPVAAWAAYHEAEELARAKTDDRRSKAAAKAVALEAYLPRLVVADPRPDLVITIHAPIPRGEWNGPLRRPPGTYEVVATAPCRRPFAARAVIAEEGRSEDVRVPSLSMDPACLPAPDTGRSQRLVGYSVGAAGVVLLVVGAAFGAMASSTKSDLVTACGGRYEACSPLDRPSTDRLNDEARSQALWSTVGVVAGGAALVAGLIVILTSPARGSGTTRHGGL